MPRFVECDRWKVRVRQGGFFMSLMGDQTKCVGVEGMEGVGCVVVVEKG